MLVVGIETIGLCGGVALLQDGVCLASRSLDQAGRRHAQSLVLELHQLLESQHAGTRDVNAIAVSRGPGSFTGLRVGIVCAKTFAYATGCRFVAVDTFSVVAANCPGDVHEVWVVEDAQRGDLFVGRYERCENGTWSQTSPLEIVAAEDWLPQRLPHEFVTGRGLLRCDPGVIRARCLGGDEFVQPRAENVAVLGEKMLQNPSRYSASDFDAWTAVPVYVRKSAAEEKFASR